MKIQRLVESNTFHGSEEQIREWYQYGVVGVHYASMGYGDTVKYVNALRREVRKEYPKIKDDDMRIVNITEGMSNMHAHFMTLFVPIPIDEFFRLREEGKINIL